MKNIAHWLKVNESFNNTNTLCLWLTCTQTSCSLFDIFSILSRLSSCLTFFLLPREPLFISTKEFKLIDI